MKTLTFMHAAVASIFLIVVGASCSDANRAGPPLAPSTTDASPTPTERGAGTADSPRTDEAGLDSVGAEDFPAHLNRDFYRRLVFNAAEAVGPDQLIPSSMVLDNPGSMNFVFFRGDIAGECEVGQHSVAGWYENGADTISYRHQFAEHTPRVIRRATGDSFSGELLTTADRARFDRLSSTPGWIGIAFEHCGFSDFDCGRIWYTAVGADPGAIRALLQPDCKLPVWSNELFRLQLAHEIGHALGFWHLQWEGHIMGWSPTPPNEVFSDMEAQHMRYAFREGRGVVRFQRPSSGRPLRRWVAHDLHSGRPF